MNMADCMKCLLLVVVLAVLLLGTCSHRAQARKDLHRMDTGYKLTTMARPITEQLKAAIRKAEKRGMTHYAIGKASGIGHGNIGRYCSGEIVPKLDTAEKIVKAIGGSIHIDVD